MDQFVLFLIAALTGLGGFTGLLVKRYLDHLESDLAYARKTAHRGTETAEKAVKVAEERV